MEPSLTIAAGAVTRLLAMAIGGFLCYLGYRLFLEVPLPADSKAEISGIKGVTVKLTRIGPGVFFALFGTALVLWSLARPFEYSAVSTDPGGQASEVRAGSMSDSRQLPNLSARRNMAAQDVQWLNQVMTRLDAADRKALVHDPDYMLPRIKLMVMRGVWDPSVWGSESAFQRWLEQTGGLTDPRDPATAAAAAFFNATP